MQLDLIVNTFVSEFQVVADKFVFINKPLNDNVIWNVEYSPIQLSLVMLHVSNVNKPLRSNLEIHPDLSYSRCARKEVNDLNHRNPGCTIP